MKTAVVIVAFLLSIVRSHADERFWCLDEGRLKMNSASKTYLDNQTEPKASNGTREPDTMATASKALIGPSAVLAGSQRWQGCRSIIGSFPSSTQSGVPRRNHGSNSAPLDSVDAELTETMTRVNAAAEQIHAEAAHTE
jgi:hypothetical protein